MLCQTSKQLKAPTQYVDAIIFKKNITASFKWLNQQNRFFIVEIWKLLYALAHSLLASQGQIRGKEKGYLHALLFAKEPFWYNQQVANITKYKILQIEALKVCCCVKMKYLDTPKIWMYRRCGSCNINVKLKIKCDLNVCWPAGQKHNIENTVCDGAQVSRLFFFFGRSLFQT